MHKLIGINTQTHLIAEQCVFLPYGINLFACTQDLIFNKRCQALCEGYKNEQNIFLDLMELTV